MTVGENQAVVSVDLGGTQIRAVVFSRGKFISHVRKPTEAWRGRDAVLERVTESIREAVREAGVEMSACLGIGIGCPGPLDTAQGIVYDAPNLPGWTAVPVRDIVSSAFHASVYLENDANLGALGEHRFGAGRDARDMVYVTVSTGVGGGIISGGRLLSGFRGSAGEIGHITINIDGPPCPCGNVGCLEQYAAGPAIARRAVAAIEQGTASVMLTMAGGNASAITGATVNEAAAAGDALAVRLLTETGGYLGAGIVTIAHMLNPELVIVGGGVSRAGDLLLGPARDYVSRHAMRVPRESLRIVQAELADDAGLYGGVALVLQHGVSAGETVV